MNSIRTVIATALAAALLGGCGGCAPDSKPPLAGTPIGGPFTLVDGNGRTVHDSDFLGRYRLVYFGYTSCPDVCPNDLQKLGEALRRLDKEDPALSAKVVPIFISVDPERDTPAAVKEFVANFHPRMVGLTGSAQAIAKAAAAYRITYAKQPVDRNGFYRVDHMTLTYLMGMRGEPIALITRDMSVDEIAAVIRRWVK